MDWIIFYGVVILCQYLVIGYIFYLFSKVVFRLMVMIKSKDLYEYKEIIADEEKKPVDENEIDTNSLEELDNKSFIKTIKNFNDKINA